MLRLNPNRKKDGKQMGLIYVDSDAGGSAQAISYNGECYFKLGPKLLDSSRRHLCHEYDESEKGRLTKI
jgi:hypothetical protein